MLIWAIKSYGNLYKEEVFMNILIMRFKRKFREIFSACKKISKPKYDFNPVQKFIFLNTMEKGYESSILELCDKTGRLVLQITKGGVCPNDEDVSWFARCLQQDLVDSKIQPTPKVDLIRTPHTAPIIKITKIQIQL